VPVRVRLTMLAIAVVAVVAGAASAETAFPDPAGDSGGDVDITLVTVGIDRTTGIVRFAVTVTGFDPSNWDGRPRNFQAYLLNRATGAELALIADGVPGGTQVHIGHPKPPSWPFEELPPTMTFERTGNVLTWTFPQSEIGVTDAFDFRMYTQIPDVVGGTWHIADQAPDGTARWWTYYVEPVTPATPEPVAAQPVFGAATIVPARPVAGKKLLFTLGVRRSDTGAPLTTGRMTCEPSVAGVVLKHTESFASGKARLSLVVPKTAKGKLLKVRVTITWGGETAKKVVTYRVA
jgi:hypothetical protein